MASPALARKCIECEVLEFRLKKLVADYQDIIESMDAEYQKFLAFKKEESEKLAELVKFQQLQILKLSGGKVYPQWITRRLDRQIRRQG